MTTTTVHSFKGGTGKSLLAVTLAYHYSKQGKKVLVIDGDYYAPCLETFFPTKKSVESFTSFLKGDHKFTEVISETNHPNLWVGYAPTPSFGQEILQADVKTHGKYLKRILEGIKTAHEKLGFDEIVIDNSSGISLAAINFLTCSDRSLMVIRPVRYGVETTYDLINTIYRKLKYADPKKSRKDFLVWNQVPVNSDSSTTERIEKYLQYWKDKFSESEITYGTTIPYISDIVAAMIADNPLDLPKLTGLVETHIGELVENMGD
jgi:MinD-like ATPase involved in chromosome partitioning or flagellar assembly